MPQFELDTDAADTPPAGSAPRLVRGRSREDAVRRALKLDPDVRVEFGAAEAGTHWAELRVDGGLRGRLRPRDRMRFRRD